MWMFFEFCMFGVFCIECIYIYLCMYIYIYIYINFDLSTEFKMYRIKLLNCTITYGAFVREVHRIVRRLRIM